MVLNTVSVCHDQPSGIWMNSYCSFFSTIKPCCCMSVVCRANITLRRVLLSFIITFLITFENYSTLFFVLINTSACSLRVFIVLCCVWDVPIKLRVFSRSDTQFAYTTYSCFCHLNFGCSVVLTHSLLIRRTLAFVTSFQIIYDFHWEG